MPWAHRYDVAYFEPYVVCREDGRATFGNRLFRQPGRQRWRNPRHVKYTRVHKRWFPSFGDARINNLIMNACRLVEPRHLMPVNPMLAHLMRVEDAMPTYVARRKGK